MLKIPGPNNSVNDRLGPLYGDCVGNVAAGVHVVATRLMTDSSTLSHSRAPPAAPAIPSAVADAVAAATTTAIAILTCKGNLKKLV